VRTLESVSKDAGEHEVRWDGTNASGRPVASGTYFLRLESEGEVKAGKVSVLR
jgi:flagellar hook assembly protein FlgD